MAGKFNLPGPVRSPRTPPLKDTVAREAGRVSRPRIVKRRRTYVTLDLKSTQTEISREDAGDSVVSLEPQPSHKPSHWPDIPASADDEVAAYEVSPTEVLPSDEGLNAAILACAEARPSFFAGLNQTGQALAPVHALLTMMLEGGDPVIDAVIHHPEFPPRERAPSRDKPALVALHLAAKPETERQRKWCSEWASALIQAVYEGVAPEGFADWAAGVTLKECKAAVRERRRAEKAAANAAGDTDETAQAPVFDQEVADEPVEDRPTIDLPELIAGPSNIAELSGISALETD